MHRHSHNSHQCHKGAALITALFIMTLVAIAATAMSVRFQMDIHRTRLVINADQAFLAAQAVEFWSIGLLKQAASTIEAKQQNIQIDHLPAAFPAALLMYPQITVHGQLEDLQGKFNLNNLAEKNQIPSFVQLLMAADTNLKAPDAQAIAKALYEWLSPGAPGAASNPDYPISHTQMSSISEFRLVQGVSADLYQKVVPYVCTLPEATLININTASIPVLETLGVHLTPDQAQLIIDNRGKDGYQSLADLMNNPKLKDLGISENQITVVSNYFLATAVATVEEQQLTVYTILERTIEKNTVKVDKIAQTLNTL